MVRTARHPHAVILSGSPSQSLIRYANVYFSIVTSPLFQLEADDHWAASVQILEHCLQLARDAKADDQYPVIDFRLGCAYEKSNNFVKAVEVCWVFSFELIFIHA